MPANRTIKAITAALAFIALFAQAACDSEHNVNAGNLITVSGYVFQSRTNRTGVADVTVIIEKAEDSGSSSVMPDIFVSTDADGRWEARFTLGYTEGDTPVDIIPVQIEESARILMLSNEGKAYDLGSGFTFQAGQTYKVWDVFLEDFGAFQPDEGGGSEE